MASKVTCAVVSQLSGQINRLQPLLTSQQKAGYLILFNGQKLSNRIPEGRVNKSVRTMASRS